MKNNVKEWLEKEVFIALREWEMSVGGHNPDKHLKNQAEAVAKELDGKIWVAVDREKLAITLFEITTYTLNGWILLDKNEKKIWLNRADAIIERLGGKR